MLNVSFYVCMALIFAASVPIWKYAFRCLSSRTPVIEPRLRLASPIGLIDVGVILFLWLGSQLLAGTVFAIFANVKLNELESMTGQQMTMLMLIAAIAQVIAVIVGYAFLWLRYSDTRVFGWYPSFLQVDLKLGFAAFLVATPVVLVAQTLLSMLVEYHHPTLEAMVDGANVFTIIAVWIAAVIGAPIAEEVIFRGWIQNWLQRLSFRPGQFASSIAGGWWQRPDEDMIAAVQVVENVLESETGTAQLAEPESFGDSNPYASTGQRSLTEASTGDLLVKSDSDSPLWNWGAIVITSVLFAMMHIGQGLAPIPLFGLSILLGYMYQRTGSLIPCIALHMLNNGYSVFWLTIQILFGDPTAELP